MTEGPSTGVEGALPCALLASSLAQLLRCGALLQHHLHKLLILDGLPIAGKLGDKLADVLFRHVPAMLLHDCSQLAFRDAAAAVSVGFLEGLRQTLNLILCE